MRYLLDSDWIINLLAGKKDAQDKIQRIDPDEIGISLITVAEIYESAYHFTNPDAHIEKFRAFLKNFGSPGIPVVTGQSSLSHRAKALEILG